MLIGCPRKRCEYYLTASLQCTKKKFCAHIYAAWGLQGKKEVADGEFN